MIDDYYDIEARRLKAELRWGKPRLRVCLFCCRVIPAIDYEKHRKHCEGRQKEKRGYHDRPLVLEGNP